ncbi:MAG: error-prone DNA polymerase [Candidatus Accumulibacter sp.]|uniref:error-prone DNA polymerase n=1 Tax=Accumulibacter sp. TaxID=2053492 RepID=UPI0025EEBE1A|nr:error-prone DNA polymerase [Accumulibacter sp.]MCM8595777.1 error-prone DNA polymerase [Accumulibacter sp.]MCM8626498.1 error-prone DNA polymerase [Accumulibacter sp.]MDS4049925.1 error-prone DNA polymerase [Accumulibacter sp.]
MLPAYAELHCCSNFSFLRGASHPEELVERAHVLGYSALAITDEASLAGIVRAHKAASAIGLKLIVGAEFRVGAGRKESARLVLLARNRSGYGNLSALITLARRRSPKGEYRLWRSDFENPGSFPSGSGALPDCLALWIPDGGATPDDVHWLAERFPGRAWLAVELHCGPDDATRLATLRELARASHLPAVAAGDVHMHLRARRPLQDTLTAIRLRTTVFAAGHALFANGERHLRTRLRLGRLYPPELLAETLRIAERCDFSLDELRYEYPDEIVPDGLTPSAYLRAEVDRGLQRRYAGAVPAGVRERVEHELALIADLAYEPYFLTVYDIVNFARSRNILCQGRGSAANSAVCYCLGITEVDPARSNLLFERFISRERGEPPDIDVDFEHERREEVIQYLYRRYGRERAALAAAVVTYRTRGALRDVGRALAFGNSQIAALTASLAWWDRREQLPDRLRAVGLDPDAPRVARWLALADELRGFPRHLSQHVGGFVISRGPLARLVPLENAAMPERTVIQWDKDDLDALGLLKVDILALGMLSAIHRALDLIGRRIDEVPAEDPAVYEMIRAADTVGVFQIESRAQMAMLPRLQPRHFYDLVIEVAIVRPGPIQGDMVHPYLRRRHGREAIEAMRPEVAAVLGRTCGVPIFQEQVMQLAVAAAGFTPGEADQLRRAMAAWRRKGGLEPFEEKLISGMRQRGYDEAFAQRIFAQIRGFGEYGFPESHAASFALLVYVSAWLKRHHPAAFLCALLNSQPMGFYSPSQLVQDARRHGVEVRPASACRSAREARLEDTSPPAAGPAVRLGLSAIGGLSEAAATRLVAARAERAFVSIADLAARARIARHDLDRLAAAGALADLAGHRRQAVWIAAGIAVQADLLSDSVPPEAAVEFDAPGEAEELIADYATTGLTLGRHPLSLLRRRLAAQRFLSASELNGAADRQIARAAGIVTCRQRPGTSSGIVFVTLEDETGLANVVVHSRLVEKQRRELLGARLLGVFGQVQREGTVVHLVAGRLVDLSALLGRLPTSSRDFC